MQLREICLLLFIECSGEASTVDVYHHGIKQVAKVTAVSIPLALLIGFSEECVYRGFFPLLLAAKTGLPLSAIVGISASFCGVRVIKLTSSEYLF